MKQIHTAMTYEMSDTTLYVTQHRPHISHLEEDMVPLPNMQSIYCCA